MEFFNQRWPGEIATRVAINERVANLVTGEMATAIISILSMLFYAVAMLFYDVALTLMGIGMAAVNVIALQYVSRRRIDESQKLERARGQVAGAAAGGLMMMESLKSTGTESEFFQDWSGRYAKSMNAEQQLGVSTTMLNSIPTLLMGINNVLILAFGGFRVVEGHLSVGMLLAFQSLMGSFMAPTNKLVALAGQVQEMEAGMKRLDDVLRYPPDPIVASGINGDGGPDEIVQLTGELEIRNVTFGYSRLEKPLIQEFSMTLKPGSRVALVGKSGSGKSTIAKLVAGLFDPWSGEILFDGKPREEVERSVLANSLAVVDQDIFLFGGSVRDNITLWDATITAQNMVGAAKDASIHDDIAVRKDGYEYVLQEGGGNLSGGQRQRLEIARALAVNPTILVLDEATSALDANTEKIIDDHLRRRGCTCIIVAHRLSTIRDADEILVLEKGQVVQRGTHEELKDLEGPYARLIEN
jgi:NHLM bacteriocin system ABC transporter peptidase/ATP-binding protein